MTPREPLPSFRPFWRYLLLMTALTVAIGIASAVTGLALTG